MFNLTTQSKINLRETNKFKNYGFFENDLGEDLLDKD